MTGQTVSHYEILERLGGGGMGVVYKAKDTRLERIVALKFLPPDLTTDAQAKTRFIREARAASSIDHHNICTIYEIEETDDGQLFICMAYYEGETLKQKIARGPLTIDDAIDITTGAAQGLGEAHYRGMVHRDVKPSNLIVTRDGIVKVADFGLAKLTGMTRVTKTGTPIGTIAYMSPEQARGEEMDLRSDVWSLGVVLYEMLTGHLPFSSDHQEALSYMIMNEAPKSFTSLRNTIPETVHHVIAKALQKDPNNRYQNMQTLIEDLNLPYLSMPVVEKKKSIIVLPFDDISPSKDNEYFSEGLTEEITTDLSKISSLCVISRRSARKIKETGKDTRTIGRELNAQYLLEGSIRKLKSRIRITVQLIDAVNDESIWAEKYNGAMEDIFDIQERVSSSVVSALKLKLTPEEKRHMKERPVEDIKAFQWYLKARQDIMRFTEDGLDRAHDYLEKALGIAGENARLLAGMGYVYWSYVNLGLKSPDEFLTKAEACAQKAFDLEPESSHAHMLMGVLSCTKGKPGKAAYHLKRSLHIDPNDPDALFWLVMVCGLTGKTALAMQYARRLLDVDPLTPVNYATPGFALLNEGRFDLALEREKQWNEMEPDSPISCFWYGWVLAHLGRLDDAFKIFARAEKKAPRDIWTLLCKCFTHAFKKDSDALMALTVRLGSIAKWDAEFSWFLSECFALVGDKNEALDWLENAVNRGFINYPLITKLDPFIESIRDEKRFELLRKKIKYEWEHFEV